MGSGSTSRPSARTPACASSHITLESQSKNWIFIWLTLSTLRVGCSHYTPSPFYFTCWHLSCLLFLSVKTLHPMGLPRAPVLRRRPAACSRFPLFLSTLSVLLPWLPCHVPHFRASPSLENTSYPKDAAGLRTGAAVSQVYSLW